MDTFPSACRRRPYFTFFCLSLVLVLFLLDKASSYALSTGKHLYKPHQKLFMASEKNQGSAKKGFGNQSPQPKVVIPASGSKHNLEKFLMMYTCKLCSGRNAQMVSKVAYNYGMVVSFCKHCQVKHLIADNEGKMDFPKEYGKKIEEYLRDQGETIQKLSITSQELEDNYLLDIDGVLTLQPRTAGQPPKDATIVDLQQSALKMPPPPRMVVVDDEGGELVIQPLSDRDSNNNSDNSSKEENGILPWISVPPPVTGDSSDSSPSSS